MNVYFELTGVTETTGNVLSLDERIRREIHTELENDMAELATLVVTGKLAGQVLNKRSGRLSSAVSADVSEASGMVIGRTYVQGVPYAAIQEYGGQTGPHDIIPTVASSLMFPWNGDMVFARKVHHPGSKIPEASYLRSALFDMHDQILQDLQDATIRGAKS